MKGQKTAKFYDDFVDQQLKSGIHHRHLAILKWLQKFSMPQTGNFLEIGCGIGTQTELLLQELSLDSKVTAIDISEKSIAYAKKRLKLYDNVTLIVGDITEINLSGKFDVIILPDVIEHIPLELHSNLFKKLAALLEEKGFLLIHKL